MKDKKRSAYRAGHLAEIFCILWLCCKGYAILERRWKSPYGEIDIIARKKGLLVFFEVKARPDEAVGLESVRTRQRQRIANAAEAFLASRPEFRMLDARFDVMVATPWRLPHHLEHAWEKQQ